MIERDTENEIRSQAPTPEVTATLERHDSATMSLAQEKLLWDEFYAAQHRLEAAAWPDPVVTDGTAYCPWCSAPLFTIGAMDDYAALHRVLVGVTYQSPGAVGRSEQEIATFTKPLTVYMLDSGDAPDDSAVAWSCDECDGSITLDAEVIW